MFVEDKNKFPTVIARPSPFTLDSLISWLEEQDGGTRYCYVAFESCLWARYCFGLGGEISGNDLYVISDHSMSASLRLMTWQAEVAIGQPRTYAAALARARSIKAGT